VILGIPDLRLFSDPYIDMVADREKGLLLDNCPRSMTFEALVDYYYSVTSAVPPAHAAQYKRGLLTAVPRAAAALNSWQEMSAKSNRRQGSLLEVGCGTAPLLIAANRRFEKVVGLDISFRWLVMAKKRLAEAGLDCPLICGCAEALPFPKAQFDVVALESALESVQDQRKTVRECLRVLMNGGSIWVSTPNRYSLGPDPHLGLWAGSLMPERWTVAYARWCKAVPPRRNLLSAASLRRLLEDAGVSRLTVSVPEVAKDQRESFGFVIRTLIDSYHLGRRMAVTRNLLQWVGPFLHAIGDKPVQWPRERHLSLRAGAVL
jgi:ubiquinone/menaquinone biosynthesis C-methylase UbiE